eukprot:gene13025-14363_t
MESRRNKSSRIARRAVHQEARPSGPDSPEVEKYATESDSSQGDLPGNQNQDIPNPEPAVITNKKAKTNKWSNEDYRNVLRAFFTAQLRPMGNVTQDTYENWRKIVGPEFRTNIDAGKLGNVRRDIINSKRLTDAQIEQVRIEISEEPREIEIGDNHNVVERAGELRVNVVNLSPDDIENMVNVVRNGRDPLAREEDQNDAYKERNREKIEEACQNIIRELSVIDLTEMTNRENLPKITPNSKANEMIKLYNVALKEVIKNAEKDLNTMNNLFYSTAKVITAELGVKVKKKRQ